MSDSQILSVVDNGVARIVINRAERRNALNEQVLIELREAFEVHQIDPAVRVILITGAGDQAFCAGADLKPSADTFGFDPSQPRTAFAELLRTAKSCDLPIVARVNGHCLAGGMGILSMCDMAVASDNATFGLPEVKIGMFPMQVAALLRSLILPRKFDEMCITGELVKANDALEMGLVNYVTEPALLDSKISWLIDRIIDKSPTAIRRGKYAVRAIRDMSLDQGLTFMETQLGTLAMTEDAKVGLAAFNEKRKPTWTGR